MVSRFFPTDLINTLCMYWAGCNIDIGDIVYEPPRSGPTLWEIGIPDRSAAEFYVPDPNPKYINKLYVNHPDRLAQTPLYVGTLWNHSLHPETPVLFFIFILIFCPFIIRSSHFLTISGLGSMVYGKDM